MTENNQEKRKHRIFGRSFLFFVLFMVWVGNAALRLLFGCMAATGVQLLDIPVSQSTTNILVTIFLFLGVSGFIVAIGFWQKKRWGFLGTMMVILGTIVFDIWGMTIQYTAIMGFVVPVLVLIYLVINRTVFFQIGGPSLDASMR
ncbi:MAG: hypothetical protein ACFFAX_16300 [Promethearchaeota archaeon]